MTFKRLKAMQMTTMIPFQACKKTDLKPQVIKYQTSNTVLSAVTLSRKEKIFLFFSIIRVSEPPNEKARFLQVQNYHVKKRIRKWVIERLGLGTKKLVRPMWCIKRVSKVLVNVSTTLKNSSMRYYDKIKTFTVPCTTGLKRIISSVSNGYESSKVV